MPARLQKPALSRRSGKKRRADRFAELRRDLRISLLLMLGVSCAGTLGYMLIEGWGFLDSLFMTTITLSSVGYGETHALHPVGRIFTIALIGAGVFALGNVVNQVARAISEGYFQHELQDRRRTKMISQLKDHYIVCGYGRIGQQICQDLAAEGVRFVVLERDPQLVSRAEEAGVLVLCGDATSDQLLQEAGIERALCVLCALPSDAENLYVVLSAKTLNPGVRAIARATNEEGIAKLRRVGADQVVSPYLTGARRMATLAVRPQVVELVEAVGAGGDRVYIEELVLADGEDCPYVGQTLGEAELGRRTGVLVLALRRQGGCFLGNPPADTRLQPGDMLICMGSGEQLRKTASILLPATRSAAGA